MNKRVILISCLVVLVGVAGVIFYINQENKKAADNDTQNSSQEVKKEDVREVVWKQLTPQQKERADGTWRDGTASKMILERDNNAMTFRLASDEYESYIGKEVYFVNFPTGDINENFPIYADIDTYTIVGYGLVD